jgi:hypothetical protein
VDKPRVLWTVEGRTGNLGIQSAGRDADTR